MCGLILALRSIQTLPGKVFFLSRRRLNLIRFGFCFVCFSVSVFQIIAGWFVGTFRTTLRLVPQARSTQLLLFYLISLALPITNGSNPARLGSATALHNEDNNGSREIETTINPILSPNQLIPAAPDSRLLLVYPLPWMLPSLDRQQPPRLIDIEYCRCCSVLSVRVIFAGSIIV